MASRSASYIAWIQTTSTCTICEENHSRLYHLSEKGNMNHIVDTCILCRFIDKQLLAKLEEVFLEHTTDETRIFIMKRLQKKVNEWHRVIKDRCKEIDAGQRVFNECARRIDIELERLNDDFEQRRAAAWKASQKAAKRKAAKPVAVMQRVVEKGTQYSSDLAKEDAAAREVEGKPAVKVTTAKRDPQAHQSQALKSARRLSELQSRVSTLHGTTVAKPTVAKPAAFPSKRMAPSTESSSEHTVVVAGDGANDSAKKKPATKKMKRDFDAGLDALEDEQERRTRAALKSRVDQWRFSLHE